MIDKRLVITIDGPGGSGKSTLARALADRLGYLYLDTGAIYRAVALAAQRASCSWCDESGVSSVARDIVARRRLRFERDTGGGQRVVLDGADVSEAIRTPEMSAGASTVSAHPSVRRELLQLQRDLAAGGGVVVEGRDTGTVVFPDADIKFFMHASPEERARRRHEELRAKGMRVTLEDTLADLNARDKRDTERQTAPLARAPDAIDVDTTGMTIGAVLDLLLQRVGARAAG